MYEVSGWLNVIILLLLVLPFVLIRLNKAVFKTRNPRYFNFIKSLRKIHKPLGILFAVFALVHGYMALGELKLHTGSLVFFSVVLTMVLGMFFYKSKKKSLFNVHKILALITFILLIVHIVFPWLI